MRRTLSLAATIAAILVFAIAGPVGAIRFGSPDASEHPYVGEFIFFNPDIPDPRFPDPGAWFDCSGTLMDATHVVTAGHCTFAVGLDGASTTGGGDATTAAEGGVGGNDTWISFDEQTDFSMLQPSSTFTTNAARYASWSAALNASSKWHRGVAMPHPGYNDADDAFFLHDVGVVTLKSGVSMTRYGQLAPEDYLDRYTGKDKHHAFEVAGYGLEKVTGKADFGGDTRMKANPTLFRLASTPPETYVLLTDNASSGGTCFGDSGGPTFDNTTSRLVVAVTSFGSHKNCNGPGGAYRLDQPLP